jgi:hypothetical protein
MMSAPSYQGPGQPAASSGTLLGGLLGQSAPAYVGNGQPSSASSGGILGGLFGTGTPAYRPAPSLSTQASAATPPRPQLDPDPFGSGPIAIVIPRQG